MQWFRNFRTSVKILLLVCFMVVLTLIVSVTGYRTSVSIARGMNNMYNDYVLPAIWISETKTLAVHSRREILSLISAVDEDEMRDLEDKIEGNRRLANEMFGRYEKTNMTQTEKGLLAELYKVRDKTASLRDEAVAIGKIPDRLEELNKRMRSGGDISDAEDEYMAAFDRLVQELIRNCDQINEASQKTASDGVLRIVVSSITAMLTGLLFGVIVSRLITGPISKIQQCVKVFSDGDLVSTFPTAGQDELGSMGRGLQGMADNLKGIIGSVKEASRSIAETAQEFSSLAEETNSALGEFRASVDEMGSNLNILASTGEEVNASVEEVAAGAQATAEKGTDIARQVDDAMMAGENGMSAVRRAVDGIDGVAKNASDAAQSVQELGARTRQIQSFVSQIGGIADQTNLLALNAAIEAARAGDAGRGFAVVAEEVRKLAEDSNVAAKNIEELAKTITGDLDRVVNLSLGNAKVSQEASGLSREIEEILKSMLSYLKGISAATQDLAAVSQEQAASSEEIAEAVQNIATKVVNTAEAGDNIRSGVADVSNASGRIATGAEHLSMLSGQLLDILAFFRVEDVKTSGSHLRALPGERF
ncbi:MAG: methyl-accepting chemotaxis protein [Synergistaceae bacterium]|jgi:methyl-accepting chemotaxis protein|nr:methyl-accepting chemotaxis protein [Synergistaceae bacterium]